MKRLIIFLLLSAISIFGQRLPEQKYINYKGTSIHLQDSPDFQYPKNTFALGWHWANGKYTTGALDMNYIHTEIQESAGDPNYNNYNIVNQCYKPNYFADSSRMIMRSTWIGGNWGGWNPEDARALHYIPTLQEDDIKDTIVDVTNGFLGFKYINPTATITGRSLYLDSAYTGNGIILSDNVLANRCFF